MRIFSRLFFAALLTLISGHAAAQNLPLADSLERWGYGKDTNKSASMGRWSMKGFSIAAEKNKSYVELGGVRVWLGNPIVEGNGKLFISKRDHDKTLSPIVATSSPRIPALRTIVIDPGHGGKDPGNMNEKMKLSEKTMTLDVARRLKSILEEKGYRVLLTRTRDSFVELDGRSAFGNRNKADLFISIHFNGAATNTAAGIETYCLTPAGQFSTNDAKRKTSDTEELSGNRHDIWNTLYAYLVQKTLVDRLDAEDRGVRRARFAVLRDLQCPGILVECGFMNNPAEAKKISNPVYRESIAQGIADATSIYHARLQKLAKKNTAAKTTPKK